MIVARGVLDRVQVPLYLAAALIGGAAGFGWSGAAGIADRMVLAVLAALLYVTFLQIPLGELRSALRDRRFLAVLLAVNFVAVPLVVWALLLLAPDDTAVRLGIVLVLLVPCTDWVFSFTALGRGSARHLIVNAPLLLLVQMALLPGLALLLVGGQAVEAVSVRPFLEALVLVIALPLLLAALTEALDAVPAVRVWRSRAAQLPVPLLAVVIALVVATQAPALDAATARAVAGAVPIFVLFAVAMVAVGAWAARRSRLPVAQGRALTFSAVSRNSFVVLPLALALPDELALAALVIVVQSLVELPVLIGLVRLLPAWILPDERRAT